MVLVDGNVSVTDGRLWYQLGRLGSKNGTFIRSQKWDNKHRSAPSRYLFRFIQDLAILLKPSGLGVVMASKSTSWND